MVNWYSTIYKACIYSSIIAFIIGFFTSSAASFGAYIAGYSVLTLGMLMILVILFSHVLKSSSSNSFLQILYSIFTIAGPFIVMLGVISFVLYSLIQYKNNIIKGHVSPSYNSFSNIIVLLLMLQLFIVINNINTDNFQATGKISKVISSILYLLGVLTGISSIILYTVLKYYSTDGFTIN